jgi:hypothetical protein
MPLGRSAMEIEETIKIMRALADGINPETGWESLLTSYPPGRLEVPE